MIGSKKEWFWRQFDEGFELYPLTLLKGLTHQQFDSMILVNTFSAQQKSECELYLKQANALLKSKEIEPDVRMVFNQAANKFLVHSIHLNNYFLTTDFNTEYESFDDLFLRTTNRLDFGHFTYLLGFFIKNHQGNRLYSNNIKQLYILTRIIEKFCFQGDFVELRISNSIDAAYLEIHNEILIEQLNKWKAILL